ncbi:MAG: InlB B-repeat-containing protein [Lachnospiraceae bacterium]|nr:InlB B-repeat-containing protein [Lachnospiraceae bacterium]
MMKSGKRILAGILAAIMVLSSAQLPGDISHAEELPVVQENITGEESAAQEDASQQKSGPDQEDGEDTREEEKTDQPGTGTPEEVPGENGGSEEDDPTQPETPKEDADQPDAPGEETPDQPGAEPPVDGGSPADQMPSQGEEEENPEEEADDENGEPDAALPAEDETVSENDLQISGNDLMSVGEPEVWANAEIEGAYQFGGAPSADEGIALYAESAFTDEQIMDYLYQQMKAHVTPIDVSRYDIPYETTEPAKIGLLVSGVLNEHPDLYYVNGRYSYNYSPVTSTIMQLSITYNTTFNDAECQKGVSAALASVEQGMSDLQKAIVLHDYLAVNCEYDYENLNANTLPSESFNIYGVFVKRTAVCQGYALAYKYLLNQVGIECHMVTSTAMNHAWNLIKLDGQYYQVDVTWDDPVWDLVGRAVHSYMFCSDAVFQDEKHKHHDWVVTRGSSVVDYQATDTRYDNAFWTDCTSPMVISGSNCYYISPDGGPSRKPALMKTNLNNVTTGGMPLQEIDKWLSWPNGPAAWQGAYSGLFCIDDRLYFNDKTNIYSVAMNDTDIRTEFTADTKNGYIYGSAYYKGAVRYSLHQSPNLTEKEEVLKADIDVGGTEPAPLPESGVALGLDNLSHDYTALDDSKISSTADGRPKLLVFYRNSCGNCQSTVLGISRSIDRFAGIDVYALEIDGGAKETVAAFQKQYGCEQITFSYDTANKNRESMMLYLLETGIYDTAVAMPVICYIDANNRLQYITRGLKTAEEVHSNLAKYCKYSQDYKIVPPNTTTYKVGQKIRLTGGTVTYPSGSGTKTVAISAAMVSGFDSSRPGICKVNVTVGGYMGSFDTLIVEEPKLTAAVGQSLREIAFPANPHGMYIWREDDTQTLSKVGVYSFLASFIPNDAEKFQGLDVQAQVTAQETLGNNTTVTLKTNWLTYNGSEQEPKVAVLSSDVRLEEGKDYVLSYADNRNAGTATVTVDGTGCYLGSISKTFEIRPASIRIRAKDKSILVGAPIPAAGAYGYEISGLAGTDELLAQPLLTCGVTDTTATGQYDIIPSGADAGPNYTITYENGRLTVAQEFVSCTVTFDVQGHGTAPKAQIGVKVGATAEKPENPTAAGYRFDGWYRDSACTKAWDFDADIVQADTTLYAKWLEESKDGGGFAFQEIADVYYTGKAWKPAVNVYDGDVLLKSGRDYQIKYYNNTNANKDGVLKQGNGEGADFNPALPYVEIIGRGNYTDRIKDGNKDTVKVNFNILRASVGDGTEEAAAGVTLKVSEQLVTAKKVQKPFSSVKYVKAMKRDVDFRLRLTVENARDQSGRSLPQNEELPNAEIPREYEGEFLLTVEGIGNYTGSICRTVYVSDKTHLMKNATVTLGKNLKNITFTGEAVKLTAAEESSPDVFTVKYGKVFLKPGRDYTVGYRNHDKVGRAELVITGNGAYVGTKTVTFNIRGKAFSARTVQVSGIENQVYTGRALTQNGVALTYSVKNETEKQLQYGTDYTITYAKNINKGSATMTFKGLEKAGYSGSFKKTFRITAADLADGGQVSRAETMAGMAFPYCKAGVKPVEEIVLTNKAGFVLRNGKDYTLAYKNNKAVADASSEKPPTVTVKGKGNYTGKFDVTFQITQRDLKHAVDEGSIQIRTTAAAYHAKKADDYAYKPAVKLLDGKTALRVNTDYELEYLCNTQADYGAYLRLYEETVKKAESGEGDPDSDKELQEFMPRAVITAKADGSYKADGEIVVPLPVYRTKLVKKNLQIEIAEAVYTGNQVTPAVTVRDAADGKALTEGKDYTVSYGANNKSGKNGGSVTITGIAPEYGGSVTVKFEIVRKAIIY